MSGTENNSVNRMKNAEDRLARAIGRLEAALDSQVHAQADAPNAGPNAGPGLADELSRLQADNAELRALVGRASERLDGTIAKLKSELSS